MKKTLTNGLSGTRRITVDRPRTIEFMGEELRVYSTPALVRDVEYSCRDFLVEHLDGGEDTVGARIEVDHLAPTLPGMWVDIDMTVAEIEGRRIVVDFTATDPVELVGRGRHVRFVVDHEKTRRRLEAKAAKARSSPAD